MTSVLVRVFDCRTSSPSPFGIGCADPHSTLAHVRSSIARAYSRMHPDRPPLIFWPKGPYILTDADRRRILDGDQKVRSCKGRTGERGHARWGIGAGVGGEGGGRRIGKWLTRMPQICDALDLCCPTNRIDVVNINAQTEPLDGTAQTDVDTSAFETDRVAASLRRPPSESPLSGAPLPCGQRADTQQFYFSASLDSSGASTGRRPTSSDGSDDDDDNDDGAIKGTDRTSTTTTTSVPREAPPTGRAIRGVVPVRKAVRHTADGRWLSAKDIVYDALSLWGTNSVLPARTTRLVMDRYPGMFERRAVTGGGPHAPVVTVDNIGVFCERLADAVPPSFVAPAVEYPQSDRCADVVARLDMVARAAAVESSQLAATSDLSDLDGDSSGRDDGDETGDERAVGRDHSSDRDTSGTPASATHSSTPPQSRRGDGKGKRDDGTVKGGDIPAPSKDSAAPPDLERGLTDGDGRRNRNGKRRATHDRRSDDDADYNEKARPIRHVRRPRRRDREASGAPTRASKRQRPQSGTQTGAAVPTRDDPPPKRRRHAVSAPTVTGPDMRQTDAVAADSTAAAKEDHQARIVARIASRATSTRPLRLWRWRERRWHLVLEAKPSLQGTDWPWEITYEARAAPSPPPPPHVNEWIEWRDLRALVAQCQNSLHEIAVVSAARRVPLIDALYGLSGTHAGTGCHSGLDMGHADAGHVSGLDLVDDGAIDKGDVVCILDAVLPALCCRWLSAPVKNAALGAALIQRISGNLLPSHVDSLGFGLLRRLTDALTRAMPPADQTRDPPRTIQ